MKMETKEVSLRNCNYNNNGNNGNGNHFSRQDTNIYHRLIRYPMFPTVAGFETRQKIGSGYAIMKAKEKVSSEDAEKLFALIHEIQTGKAYHAIAKADGFKEEVVFIETSLTSLSKTLNTHDKKNIAESLEKLATVTLIFDIHNYGENKESFKLITHPLLFVRIDKDTGKITAAMEKFFYKICLEKALSISLNDYLKLKGCAKNLYLFLVANTDKSVFQLDTVIERCHLGHLERKQARRKLKEALLSIQNATGLIKSFSVEKDRVLVSFTTPKEVPLEHQDNQYEFE